MKWINNGEALNSILDLYENGTATEQGYFSDMKCNATAAPEAYSPSSPLYLRISSLPSIAIHYILSLFYVL